MSSPHRRHPVHIQTWLGLFSPYLGDLCSGSAPLYQRLTRTDWQAGACGSSQPRLTVLVLGNVVTLCLHNNDPQLQYFPSLREFLINIPETRHSETLELVMFSPLMRNRAISCMDLIHHKIEKYFTHYFVRLTEHFPFLWPQWKEFLTVQ